MSEFKIYEWDVMHGHAGVKHHVTGEELSFDAFKPYEEAASELDKMQARAERAEREAKKFVEQRQRILSRISLAVVPEEIQGFTFGFLCELVEDKFGKPHRPDIYPGDR